MNTSPQPPVSGSTAKGWVAPSLALIPLFLLLRAYEWLLVDYQFGGADAPLPLLAATGLDLVAAVVAGLAVVLAYGLARLAGRTAARVVAMACGVALIVGHLGLIQYFAITRVPLGADLYGYSLTEIIRTVGASAPVGWSQVLAYPAFAAAYLLLVRYLSRSPRAILTFAVACVALIMLSAVVSTRRGLQAEVGWQPNKLAAWANATVDFAIDRRQDRRRAATYDPEREYPLLHESSAPDVLGPLLSQTERPPNIVVIAVESMGQVFMGEGRYGGFTPFLDELARTGLYWPNMVAGSGRSFGFMPTLYGSLPYGQSGFMSLGFRMPEHDSLISLLHEDGYHTAFFCGYNSQFDNQSVFLERQGIDTLVDIGAFDGDYQRTKPDQQGFSWGYPDEALYRRTAQELAKAPPTVPRLDMFHTMNMHEPFIVPDPQRYAALFEKRLAERDPPPAIAVDIRRHRDLFTALAYTDESLRILFDYYRRREDFQRTIFILTGDHNAIPIPHSSAIDRFHVPLIIWSPMVKEHRRFPAVSTHADITPSLLAYLHANYGLQMPAEVHWIGRGLDVADDFRSERRLPIMRVKNERAHYLDGEYYLSAGALFRVQPGLVLEPVHRPVIKNRLQAELDQFNTINDYVIANNRLKPLTDTAERKRVTAEIGEEQALLARLDLENASPPALFQQARSHAFAGDYKTARLIARRLLRGHPNYHDVRILLARTYAWDGDYDQARKILDEVHRRAPTYADAYSARADVELWDGHPAAALEAAERGLTYAPDNSRLALQKARALNSLGRGDSS